MFTNEGHSIIQTDKGPVKVTPEQFLDGWESKRPPFGQKELRVAEALDPGTYEVAVWVNDDQRAMWTDASGKHWKVTTHRRGEPYHRQGDPEPPADAEKARLLYLNLAIKPIQEQETTTDEPKYGGRFK